MQNSLAKFPFPELALFQMWRIFYFYFTPFSNTFPNESIVLEHISCFDYHDYFFLKKARERSDVA